MSRLFHSPSSNVGSRARVRFMRGALRVDRIHPRAPPTTHLCQRKLFVVEHLRLLVDQLRADVRSQSAVIVVTVLLQKGQDLLPEPSREFVSGSLTGSSPSSRNECPICFSRPSVFAIRRFNRSSSRKSSSASVPPALHRGTRRYSASAQRRTGEPAAQCCIEKLDASISGIHGAEQVDIRWDAKLSLLCGSVIQQAALVQLKERDPGSPNTFATLARLISSMSTRNGLVGCARAVRQTALEHAVSEAKRQRRVASIMRPKTLDEVLVARMRDEMSWPHGVVALSLLRIAVVVDMRWRLGSRSARSDRA